MVKAAFNFNFTVIEPDDFIDDCQPQAAALVNVLGRKKGVKNFV
jgi:hypothetical protein